MKHLFLFLIIAATACTHQIDPLKKLEGEWKAAGDDGDGHSWYLTYTFKANVYKMQGYPPIAEHGKISCKEVKGDSLLIEFKVDPSSPNLTDHTNWVLIKNNTMVLNNMNFTKSQVESK